MTSKNDNLSSFINDVINQITEKSNQEIINFIDDAKSRKEHYVVSYFENHVIPNFTSDSLIINYNKLRSFKTLDDAKSFMIQNKSYNCFLYCVKD